MAFLKNDLSANLILARIWTYRIYYINRRFIFSFDLFQQEICGCQDKLMLIFVVCKKYIYFIV